jgi:catechol 2,3-dioxygenase-like lactoylglutathione lyase family enzyme
MLDYVTLPTKDLEAAKAFFETVLGLEVGYRPTFPFAGHWVYAAGRPIVHLIPGQGGPVDRTGETIYHVAFRLDDHEALRLKLDRLSIPYSPMDLPELGERRLFIRTPTGILLELVFRDGAPNPSHPQVRSRVMPHRSTHLRPAPSTDRADGDARAKVARTFLHEFWNTGDEAVLKRALAENFADGAAAPPCAPAAIGSRHGRRLGAPDKESI